MKNIQADQRIVDCLKSLSEAFMVYDRALFYYDPSLDVGKSIGVVSNAKVVTTLKYKEYLDEIRPENEFSSEQYPEYLRAKSYSIAAKIPPIYLEAVSALMVRYEHVAKRHARYLSPLTIKLWFNSFVQPVRALLPLRIQIWIFRLIIISPPIVDRNPANAGAITREHVGKCQSLAQELSIRLQKHEQTNTWSPYSIEFAALRDMCKLIMDEIDFLNRRVGELQQRSNQRWTVFFTILGLISGYLTLVPHKDADQKAYNEKLLAVVERLDAKPVPPAPSDKPALSEPLTVTFKIPEPKPAPQP